MQSVGSIGGFHLFDVISGFDIGGIILVECLSCRLPSMVCQFVVISSSCCPSGRRCACGSRGFGCLRPRRHSMLGFSGFLFWVVVCNVDARVVVS